VVPKPRMRSTSRSGCAPPAVTRPTLSRLQLATLTSRCTFFGPASVH
jgi:hypothetical protein